MADQYLSPAAGAVPQIGVAPGDTRFEALVGPLLAALGWERRSGVAADIVLLDGGAEDAEDRFADMVGTGPRILVVVPDGRIDDWGFAMGLPGVELVPETDPEGLVRAIARMPRRANGVREGGRDDPVERLRELGIEVARIAQALGALGPPGGVADRRPSYRAETAAGSPLTAKAVRAMIRARRARDQFFAAALFADPAWDILLDLMAARLERQDVAVSSLCIAAAVPPTTALRWIAAMTEQGMLLRIADPDDRRRVFIRLSDDSAERMATCLGALARTGAVVA